jgi:hypothetical protein
MDKQTQRKQKKTLRRLARRARIDKAREETWELSAAPKRLFDEVYLPFGGPAPEPEATPTAPQWLTVSDTPEPTKFKHPLEEVDYLTVRRLDLPVLVTADYVLDQSLVQILISYCKLYRDTTRGGDKCRLCNNTGVSRWRARGAAANVCKCVRLGAAIEAKQMAEAARG